MKLQMKLSRALWVMPWILVFAAGPASAAPAEQEVEWRRTAVLVDPFRVMNGTLGGEVHYAVNDRFSALVGVRVSGFATRGEWQVLEGETITGVSSWQIHATPGINYYLTGRAPGGLWVGPRLEYTRQDFRVDGGGTAPPATTSFGASALLGYSAVLPYGLTLMAAGGVGVTHSDGMLGLPGSVVVLFPGDSGGVVMRGANTTVSLRGQVEIGWAF